MFKFNSDRHPVVLQLQLDQELLYAPVCRFASRLDAALLAISALLLAATPAYVPAAQLENLMPTEAATLLDTAHDYAARYVSALPDFLCQQTLNQFEAGKKADKWRQLDSLTSKLVFANGKERRTLELINGRPAAGRRISRRPLTTEGEFAILISNIFGESSQAAFEWQGWQLFQNRRCGVFRYRIALEHSTMKLTLSDLATATVAYGGQVVADAETGSIRRVTSEATEIPKQVRTRSIATVIDYLPVNIGTVSYLLPSDAVVEAATPSGRVRNELHFRNYQKFEAESTITFDSDSEKSSSKTPPQLK